MSSNNESQCYFVQLQFDTYLDGELGPAQRDEFQAHVQNCQSCAQEFKYAQTLYDFVLDMPQLDCGDHVLEPIRNPGRRLNKEGARPGFWQSLQDLLTSVPVVLRYAVPAVLLVVLMLPLAERLRSPVSEVPQIVDSTQATPPLYTPEEIQQALLDLNTAIEYLNSVGRRTEVMIGDRFIVSPIQESLDASFDVVRRISNDPLQDDPI